jgi:PAS domain S-box-containing protein
MLPAGRIPDLVPRVVPAAIIILFFTMVASGLLFYQSQEQQMRDQVTGDLTSIAVLKANAITDWRTDRIWDARGVSAGTGMAANADHFLTYGDTESRDAILDRFRELNSSRQYTNILLTDVNGTVRLSLDPSITPLPPSVTVPLERALASGDVDLTDLHRIPGTDHPEMDVIAPLEMNSSGTGRPAGAVLLVIDPDTYLYPFIQSWPVQSSTAETLLVEGEGDHILYLNELRHRKNSALNLTIPLTETEIPAVMAVLGKTGTFTGRDYRGVDVISVLEPVRGSPWLLVAKIDVAEAYAPWSSRSALIIALILVSLAVFLVALWMLWQRRQKYFYRAMYAVETERKAELERNQQAIAESERKYRNLYHYAQVGLFETSLKDATVVACNERYATLAGFPSVEEAIGKDILGLYANPDDRREVSRILLEQGFIGNYTVRFRNLVTGRVFWGQFSARLNTERDVAEGSLIDVTALKEAEHALLESEQLYRSLFEHMLNGFAYCRMIYENEVPTDFTYLAVNESFGKLTGLSGVEGKNVSEVIPGILEADPGLFALYDRVAGSGLPEQQEMFVATLNMWFSLSVYSPQRGYFVAVFDVITERKQAEEERAHLAAIVEFSDEAIIGKTLDGTITSWNAGAEQIYGYSAHEVVGRNISVLMPADQPDDSQTILAKIRLSEPVIRYETRRRKKDGEVINMILTVSPVKDAQNRVIGASTIAHDITERKLAEEKIQESETRYRRLFESAKDGILILNRETGEIIDANPYIETLLGYAPSDLLGKHLWDIGLFKDQILSKIAFEELQTKEYIRYEDLPLETKNGQIKEVEFVSNVYPVDSRLSVIQCNIRDITERKLLENQRELLITELERKNAELERFTYTVSHDLKSPLITIKGFAGLLEDDTRSTDPLLLKKDILRITEAAETMQVMLADLLELSRIGRIIKPPQQTDFASIVRESVDLLAVPLAERKVRIDIAPDFPVVNVDRDRIREVMVNLLENAIKFLGDRPDPLIRIGVDMDGTTPVFFVSDNGIGIDPRYLERIFNLFEKLDASRHGTGIGLTTARRIIEVHGGKIWAESDGPGKGTTFRFTLSGLPEAAGKTHDGGQGMP